MGRHNAFTFPFTFFREPARKVIPELQGYGFTGINLALNYHASRDFLLRQGPALEYLADGFHYYAPDLQRYPKGSALPNSRDCLTDNSLLDSVLEVASESDFDVNAWAVFLHNSAIGSEYPETTVTNCFGNHFLSELCPSSPMIGGYITGLSEDLSRRGITNLAIESLHFHGTHHGEHHERFFLEMSEITAFLLSLCFCTWCIEIFSGDGARLKAKVSEKLQPFLSDRDPWLGIELSQENLAELIDPKIPDYLRSREATIARRYREVSDVARKNGVQTVFIDQAPLLPDSANSPLDKSWLVGVDNQLINNVVESYEPLLYRKSAAEVARVAQQYRERITGDVKAILRPTFPDATSAENLREKVDALREINITDIDFYLLDVMRPRDLDWIKAAITS